jgi:molybdopterin molybdotransferase
MPQSFATPPVLLPVAEAERLIMAQHRDYGMEYLPFMSATGRTLTEDLVADRDMPPFDRVTMDGIGLRQADLEVGFRSFRIVRTLAAGDDPSAVTLDPGECVEIMTGAVLPAVADTIVPYEQLTRTPDGVVLLPDTAPRAGQYIHRRGEDRRQGEVVAQAGQCIGPALLQIAAAVGRLQLAVKKLPRVWALSSGDELTEVHATPQPWQIRRSNTYALQAALQSYGIAAGLRHLPDDPAAIRRELAHCLSTGDVLLLSGGVSMGKFDYIPDALAELGVVRLFHKVRQKPGKPFWFGVHPGGAVVFALPGNPVSTFLCWCRYVRPWIAQALGLPPALPEYAVLDSAVRFAPALQYFMPVRLLPLADGRLSAIPQEGHGSGDFANLIDSQAFMELPAEVDFFPAGTVGRIWRF